jgi:uncharacterized membrane protein YcjF (UPF0283 family)
MENNNNISGKAIILNYGLILGGISILLQLVQYSAGQHLKPHWIYSVISIAITILVIVSALKNLKKNNSGYLSFGQGIKTGIGISLLSVVVYIVYILIFCNFIDTEYLDQLWALEEEKMFNRNMSEEQIEQSMRMMKEWGIYFMFAGFIIIGSLLGFVVSAVTSAIIKKDYEE